MSGNDEERKPAAGRPSYLEMLRGMIRGDVPHAPAAKLIGFGPVEAHEDGTVVFELRVDERHHNPMGTLHGGILCDIGDAALGSALGCVLEPGESYTTLELKVNFLKPVRQGTLRATGRLVKKTRQIALTECDVVDEGGSLVARMSSTCMILRGRSAEGR